MLPLTPLTPGQASLSTPLARFIPVSVPCLPFPRQKHPTFPFTRPNSPQIARLKPTWPVTRKPSSLPSEIPHYTTTWTGHPLYWPFAGLNFLICTVKRLGRKIPLGHSVLYSSPGFMQRPWLQTPTLTLLPFLTVSDLNSWAEIEPPTYQTILGPTSP